MQELISLEGHRPLLVMLRPHWHALDLCHLLHAGCHDRSPDNVGDLRTGQLHTPRGEEHLLKYPIDVFYVLF